MVLELTDDNLLKSFAATRQNIALTLKEDLRNPPRYPIANKILDAYRDAKIDRYLNGCGWYQVRLRTKLEEYYKQVRAQMADNAANYIYGFDGAIFTDNIHEEEDVVRTWEFKVRGEDNIDIADVGRDLSRENPVIILQPVKDKKDREKKDKKEYSIVVLHESLVSKIEALNEDLPQHREAKVLCGYRLCFKTKVSPAGIAAWVKGIKNAPWPKGCKEKTIRAIMPKI